MAEIITLSDLPAAIQSADMVADMVDGANAKASRVAPCLVDPTSTAWVAATAYAERDLVRLAAGEFVEVTTAGTSDATIPVVPMSVGDTVEDGTVTWTRIAPTPGQLSEARLVLLGAVKRWAEAGSGAWTQQAAGPFSVATDTRQRSGFNLWPSEIDTLQDICRGDEVSSGAFSIDTAPAGSAHLPWCNLAFGATWCSCGADIAGEPIYELG